MSRGLFFYQSNHSIWDAEIVTCAGVLLQKRLPMRIRDGSVTRAVAIIRGFCRTPLNAPFQLDTDIRQVMVIPAGTAS